jgi:hypothetical protein
LRASHGGRRGCEHELLRRRLGHRRGHGTRQPSRARGDHRHRNVHRRLSAHASVPDPLLHDRYCRRDPRRDAGTRDARVLRMRFFNTRFGTSRSQVRSSLQRVRRLGPPLADESWLDLMIGMEAAIRWPPSGGLPTRRLPSRTASRSFSPTSRKAVSRYFDLDGDRHPGSECRAHPTAAARNAADDELWVIY